MPIRNGDSSGIPPLAPGPDIPALEAGLTDEQFHQIMVENPRRALTGEE